MEWLAALFCVFVFALVFAGYPVAFALGGGSLAFAAGASLAGVFEWRLLNALPERTFGIMQNQVLLAVPYFVFMGTVLERSGLAEELLATFAQVCGRLRGGLALAVVLVGTLLAAATGVVGASVVTMAMISLPVMLKNGYSPGLAGGVIAASGTLGQIIPPSVVLIVLGDQMGVSVDDLFRGALAPGLLLAGLYAAYVLVLAWLRPSVAPALVSAESPGALALARRVLGSVLPPLGLILVVLGSIFTGVATPTEAGALGAAAACGLAALRRRLDRALVAAAVRETVALTAMVVMLLIGSTMFALVFRGLEGDHWIRDLFVGMPGGRIGFLIAVNVLVFVLGCFIDFFEIAFIVVPLLVPAARALEIDLVWLGVMLGLNLQMSFLTPPFGFSLFYLRGACGSLLTTPQIYRGVMPFIALQAVVLVLYCLV